VQQPGYYFVDGMAATLPTVKSSVGGKSHVIRILVKRAGNIYPTGGDVFTLGIIWNAVFPAQPFKVYHLAVHFH